MDVSTDMLPPVNATDVHQQSHLQSLNTARFGLEAAECLASQQFSALVPC